MTLDKENARLLGDFAKKLRDQKYREVHIYYSPIDYYIIRPELVQAVEVRDYTSQQVLHIENTNWDLDLPTSLIGTVVWHKKSENPEQHPLTHALNNINFKRIIVSLTNQQILDIPAAQIRNVEETGRNVNIYMRNGNMIDVDLRYIVSLQCEQRLGDNSKTYDEAMQLGDEKKWEKSAELLSAIIKKDPTDFDAFYRLGYAQLRDKKFIKALENLEKSISLNPYNPRVWLLRSKALQELDRLENAEACLLEAIEKFPDDVHLRMELSTVYTREEKYDKAVQNQKAVLQMDPENFEEWEYLGYIADQKRDLELAISAYEKVLQLAPESSPVYKRTMQRLGCLYSHKGQIAIAMKTFQSLTEKFPTHGNGWDFLSYIYRLSDNYDLAEQAVRKAIELDPNVSSNWASLGYTLRKKDIKQAEEVCRKAIKMQPEDEYAWTALAKILFTKNETREAIKAVDKAEMLNPKSPTNIYNIADAYTTINDAKKVLYYLEKALELDKTQVGMLKNDREFDFIRENEEFKKLINQYNS